MTSLKPSLQSSSLFSPDAQDEKLNRPLHILPSTPDDRPQIRHILLHSGLFNASDADCVDEMFALALSKPSPDNYRFLSAWLDDAMIGFACYGWEALTHGTWDLFWVVTLPEARGCGVGSALLGEALRVATAEGGRLMVIYTSSTAAYAPARRLYESQGFSRTATIPEYYNVGDDLHIYSRHLQISVPAQVVTSQCKTG